MTAKDIKNRMMHKLSEHKEERVAVVLARLDERMENFIATYELRHKELMEKVDNLCAHVNDENMKMDKRITRLENDELVSKASNRTLKYVVGALVGAVGVISTFLGILTILGVI